MKRLPPAIRPDYRYLRVQVHSGSQIELGEMVETVWDAALDYLGTKGTSEADIWIIGNKFSEEEQEGVIRVKKGGEDDLRAAITFVQDLGGKTGFLEVDKVSGSLDNLDS